MYPLPRDKIIEKLKEKYGNKASIGSDLDFTEIPDEVLANAHLFGLYDKVSIQANVEMARRLKDSIKEMNESTEKYSKKILNLTIIMFVVAFLQLFVSIGAVPGSWIIKAGIAIVAIMVIWKSVIEISGNRKTK
jgi:uncharacterized membrane protein